MKSKSWPQIAAEFPEGVRVHFSGGAGCGKTSLANFVGRTFGLGVMASAARHVMASMKIGPETIRSDPEAAFEFQREVLETQQSWQQNICLMKKGLVSDRTGVDVFAYSVAHTKRGDELFARYGAYFRDYLSSPRTLTILVRPNARAVGNAKNERRRAVEAAGGSIPGLDQWLAYDDVAAFYGACKFVYDLWQIDYAEIDAAPPEDQAVAVASLVAAHIRSCYENSNLATPEAERDFSGAAAEYAAAVMAAEAANSPAPDGALSPFQRAAKQFSVGVLPQLQVTSGFGPTEWAPVPGPMPEPPKPSRTKTLTRPETPLHTPHDFADRYGVIDHLSMTPSKMSHGKAVPLTSAERKAAGYELVDRRWTNAKLAPADQLFSTFFSDELRPLIAEAIREENGPEAWDHMARLYPVAPGLMPDWDIRRTFMGTGLLTPFDEGTKRPFYISSGLSSGGYDLALGEEFKMFSPVNCHIIDPLDLDEAAFAEVRPKVCEGKTNPADGKPLRYVVLPPHSYILAETKEKIDVPADVMIVVVGKSTYARLGVIVNVTPLEAGWTGVTTLEIANTAPTAVKIYLGMGIAQAMFHRMPGPALRPYGVRSARYQNQKGLTLSRTRDNSDREE